MKTQRPTAPTRKLPSLTGLRAFDALCRNGSVSLAAEDLKVTAGAISRQIRQLEENLGIALFDRTGGRLTATEAGLRYQEEIGAAFDLVEKATAGLYADTRDNELVISCPPSFHFCWLLSRLPGFEAQHRHISVVVHTSLSSHQHNPQPDASIGVGHWPKDQHLRQRSFMANHSGPVMAPALVCRLAPKGAPLADIRHLRLRHEPQIWQEWYRDADIEAAATPSEAALDHLFLTIEAARAGLGAAIAPYAYVADDIRAGTLMAPFGFLERKVPYYIAWAENPAPKKALGLFADWLQQEGRKTPVPDRSTLGMADQE